ncbi:MAG TPA: cupredoxin domain-containing protein [Blastocatellia bacterium]|nr:cupredoxin domain-containing protein [Blastocatellia bacterium]
MILVKGGYTPDTIIVRAGRPARLNFRREETATCSDKMIFADFDKSAELPTGETVPVELLPKDPWRVHLCLWRVDGHQNHTRILGEDQDANVTVHWCGPHYRPKEPRSELVPSQA